MNLSEYIKTIGNKAAAEQFSVSERRIVSWRLGYRNPRPEMALRIEEKTGGQVTCREIFSANASG